MKRVTIFIGLIFCLIITSCSTKKLDTKINDQTISNIQKQNIKNIIDQNNKVILRDNWGVPHVYGKTDSDAAYALAYANSEDDFVTIQNTVLKSRGKYASVYGPGKDKINAINQEIKSIGFFIINVADILYIYTQKMYIYLYKLYINIVDIFCI